MDVLFAKERGSKIGRGYAGVRLEEFDLRFFLDVVNANECAQRRNTRITEVGWKRQQFVVGTQNCMDQHMVLYCEFLVQFPF